MPQKDADNHWKNCSRCGVAGEKTAHVWDGGTVTTQPGATTKGERTYHCSGCDATKTEEIDATGLQYAETYTSINDDVHAKMCISEGHTNEHGTEVAHNKVNDDSREATPATCTTPGSQPQKCSDCNWTGTREIPATGHNYAKTASYDDKEHWYECQNEGCEEKDQKQSHDFSSFVKSKTDDSGNPAHVLKCTGCEKTTEVACSAADNAQWVEDTEKTGYHYHQCSVTGCTNHVGEEDHVGLHTITVNGTSKQVGTCETCQTQFTSGIRANDKVTMGNLSNTAANSLSNKSTQETNGITWTAYSLNDTIILLADRILYTSQFGSSNSWANSTIKTQLNDNNVLDLPMGIIATYTSSDDTDPNCKVWLLSQTEVNKLFPNQNDKKAQLNGNDFNWWLRSPNGSQVFYVYLDGNVSSFYYYSNYGVRPALQLNL